MTTCWPEAGTGESCDLLGHITAPWRTMPVISRACSMHARWGVGQVGSLRYTVCPVGYGMSTGWTCSVSYASNWQITQLQWPGYYGKHAAIGMVISWLNRWLVWFPAGDFHSSPWPGYWSHACWEIASNLAPALGPTHSSLLSNLIASICPIYYTTLPCSPSHTISLVHAQRLMLFHAWRLKCGFLLVLRCTSCSESLPDPQNTATKFINCPMFYLNINM